MSALFGPVIQQGYVVPDIDEAMRHWIARGVGPFFVEKHIRPKGEYDGKAIQPDLSAAFAYSGEQQIEIIQRVASRSHLGRARPKPDLADATEVSCGQGSWS